MHPNQHAKRRKKRVTQGTKTVTVVRGKLGYGFTISGQNPCMLSCIVPGSPAEVAGLKPGDLLYFVNGQNVSRACHDDVVRMVGLSTGSLELQVAENFNSSDSSDDDYPPRSKSRYPNRVRPRHTHTERGSKTDKVPYSRQSDRHERQGHSRHYVPLGAESDLSSSLTSQEDQIYHSTDIGWPRPGQERIREKKESNPPDDNDRQANGFAYSAVQKGPVISTARKISSAAAVVKKVPAIMETVQHSRSDRVTQLQQEPPSLSQSARPHPSTVSSHVISKPEISPPVLQKDDAEEGGEEEEERESDEELPQVAESVKAIVGYIGSIETPSSHTRPHQRLQALRSAVRRLRVEKRVHTLVLMEVNSLGVTLTNAMGKQLALYPSDRIAFSGICPDDERFFGLVTLSMPDDDCSSYMGGGGGITRMPNSSCHIFMIEPELSPHSAHVQQAEAFQIFCTTNSQTRRCDEFPRSATSLILCIANLYRDAPPKQFDSEIVQSQALADPVRQAEQSNSSSNGNNSNSDSGLGLGKEEQPLEQNEQVCVIDLPSNRQHLNNSGMSVTMDSSHGSVQGQLSPEVDVVNTTRGPPSAQRPFFDARRGLNNSTSSEECWQQGPHIVNKLTPRAMPDPSCHGVTRSKSTDNVRMSATNAENLRQSMQRLLQARQQQLQEQNRLLGSDGESHAGDPVLSLSMADDGHAVLETGSGEPVERDKDVFAVPTNPPPNSVHNAPGSSVRSAFQVPRPVSAPMSKYRAYSRPETVDMETLGKLSPRAFPHTSPPSSVFRSPSAPPAPFFPHRDSDDDDDDEDDDESEDDPYIRQILEQFSKDRKAAMDEDSRRFSEGFALSKKREKEKYEVGNVQKWTKSGSFRRNQHMMLKQSFSQSHESLAVGDDPNTTNHKIITACSVNNIACQTGSQGQGETGRVASWAVNFNNLLKDPVGLSIFTEFLQKEFSEENIIFWKACEQYRQLADEQQRKAQAKDIYSRYLSSKASDPVNVDSAARSYTERFLDNPTVIMFDVAQQQIFQLMRQDSYARFLKSDMYKNKLMDEMEGKLLEAPSQTEKQTEDKTDKKKGKGKENDEKRRRSILPWKQNRKSLKSTSEPEMKKAGKKGKEEKESSANNNLNISIPGGTGTTTTTVTTSSNTVNLKKAPGPGIDLSTMRKEVFHPKESRDAPESHFKFCRIVMPDGSTTVVCAKPGQTSRSILSKLCEKRSISIASVDVFLLGSAQPLDLNDDISTLGSKEIVIERRVLFRLDLPNGKSIGVKAKPNRSIRDVFKPILNKYGYRMDNISVHLQGSQEYINLDVAVSELDNQRAVIVTDVETDMARQGTQPLSTRSFKQPLSSRTKGGHSASRGGSLEEITNKIFEDLMRGKSQLAHGFDELGILELDKAKTPRNEEARSLGLFGLLRKESWGAKDNSKGHKSKGKVTFALPRNESKKKGTVKEGEQLFEMLSGAQRLRLEDQRGVSVTPADLPSFLCQNDKAGNSQDEDAAVEEVYLDSADCKPGDMFDDVVDISKAGFLEKKPKRRETFDYPVTPCLSTSTPRDSQKYTALTTPMSEKWKSHGDHSFSQTGIIPSPREAEAYFRMSPVIVDARGNSVSRSVDTSLTPGYGRSVTQSFDESAFTNSDISRNKLDVNIASHFSSHAFRPVRLSLVPDDVAPVASPEKFSPESKKLRCSADVRNSVTMPSALPNKMSPVTRSSASSSSNFSSSSPHWDSTSAVPPFSISQTAQPIKTSSNPQQHASPSTRNTKRLSDDILIQRLQQAKRERESQVPDSQVGSRARYGHSQASSKSPERTTNTPRSKRSHSPMQASWYDQQDLAQRALLSPRFDQRPKPQSSPHEQVTPPSLNMAQRALLSPRVDESPKYRQTDPPPYQKRTSPVTPSSTNNSVAMLSSKYSGSLPNGNQSALPQRRPVTLPFNQPPASPPSYESLQTFVRDTKQSHFCDPPPYANISSGPPAYANDDLEEETVTFV